MSRETFPRADRRDFLRSACASLAGLPALGLSAGALAGCARARQSSVLSLPPADGDAPALSWNIRMVSASEPGTPLVVRGRIFAADGRTPLEGVELHVYHTDARGLYSDEDGRGREPNPRLKGRMLSDREGRYEFRTIRPASYPGTSNPAHIHTKVARAGHAERWLDNFWFADDPLVTEEMRARFAAAGAFSPILAPGREADGTLSCRRDIRLERA